MAHILAVIAAFVVAHGGSVIDHHRWHERPRQQIVIAEYPLVLRPSGIVIHELVWYLGWRTPNWPHWDHGVSFKDVRDVLVKHEL